MRPEHAFLTASWLQSAGEVGGGGAGTPYLGLPVADSRRLRINERRQFYFPPADVAVSDDRCR